MSDDTGPRPDPADATTFPAFVRAIAAAHGDRTALTLTTDDGREESIGFAALDAASARLARGLLARGVGKGTRVGFILGNGPRFAVALAAAARIGAIAIPISTLIRAGELVRVLRQSDVAGLIVQRRMLGKDLVGRLCDALPAIREGRAGALMLPDAPYLRWVASDGDDLPPAIERLADVAAAGDGVADALLREVEAEVHPTDQMIEIYTSGAMALPKGVRHAHGPVLFRARYLRDRLGIEADRPVPAVMPMFWVGGLMMALMPALAAGAETVCSERSPTSSRIAMGSVLAPEDLAAMPAAPVRWGLGMTETLGPYSLADELRVPGYPLCAPLDHIADGYEVRIVGADGQPTADGEVGELQVRGYPLTPGLHKIERDAYFEPDGFYRTGDLCERHGTRILFVGRGGDVIKTAGANVSPAEVEAEMQSLDGVHSAYVVGLPDRERGQLVAAAVVPRDGATIVPDALQAELRRRLSSYKVPQAIVILAREDVPMLFSNKVARRRMETLLAERLGRPAA